MENFIYCTEEEIRSYLQLYGRGRDSHDTELSEAVRLKRFYDRKLSRVHLIGIPVQEEGLRQFRAGAISKDEVIRDFREENTEVDILIIDAEDTQATPRDSFRGDAFQIKRLTDHQFNGDFISSLVTALQKILKKGYGKSFYLSLYIPINIQSVTQSPDWSAITTFLSGQSIPFLRIIFGPIIDQNGEELLVEIFPNLRFIPTN